MFTVVYRTGGTREWTWQACRPVATMGEADSLKESNKQAGMESIVYRESDVVRYGIPRVYDGSLSL